MRDPFLNKEKPSLWGRDLPASQNTNHFLKHSKSSISEIYASISRKRRNAHIWRMFSIWLAISVWISRWRLYTGAKCCLNRCWRNSYKFLRRKLNGCSLKSWYSLCSLTINLSKLPIIHIIFCSSGSTTSTSSPNSTRNSIISGQLRHFMSYPMQMMDYSTRVISKLWLI